MAPANPLILNFDHSVLPLPGSTSIDLSHWQEEIRFGCRIQSLHKLAESMAPALGCHPSVVFMGSGDYHHLTWLLLRRYRNLGQPIQVIVFDNHPDNMRYPFGIHCGSWVWHASRLPFVGQVHVLGITSTDVEATHSWENHVRALRSGKVRYWCVGRNLGWMRLLGIAQSQSYPSVASMLEAFSGYISNTSGPAYLSIDKDVLSPEDAHTNWDQGVMRLNELQTAIAMLKGRIIGADVTGEISEYRYQSRFKRLLSGLDNQPAIEQEKLIQWQTQHQQINRVLLESLSG